MPVKPIPEGFHALTSYLVVQNAAEAIEWYKKAFDAKETFRMNGPDGKSVMHAEMKIGDSHIMLSDETPAHPYMKSPKSVGAVTGGLMLYVKDVDSVFNRAVGAGATAQGQVSNMFWGDRMGNVVDPFGQSWSIATHVEDVAPEEIERRGREMFAKRAGG